MSDPTLLNRIAKKLRTARPKKVWYVLVLCLAIGSMARPIWEAVGEFLIGDVIDVELAKKVDEEIKAEFSALKLPEMVRSPVKIIPTGLGSKSLRDTWHSTPEGSDVFPVALFMALNDPETGRPLIESLDRMGFIGSPEDNTGLPVGFSRVLSKSGNFVMTGINCAACHSTRITYKGISMHIDGAPNLVDLEAFFERTLTAAKDLLEPRRGKDRVLFLLRFAYFNSVEVDRLREKDSGTDGYAVTATKPYSNLLPHERAAQSLQFLKQRLRSAMRIRESFKHQTQAGPGRADSFGIIRNMLMTKELVGGSGNFRPMTAPVSIPHLFGFASFTNLHWDGNTTTGTDRNYAQAIALGADLDPKTLASSTRPHALYRMEATALKFSAPKWPEAQLGRLDRDRVARGSQLFQSQSCGKCHSEETWTRLEEIGTDPNRLLDYNQPVKVAWGRPESYATNLHRLILGVKRKAYDDNNVSVVDSKLMDTWHPGVAPAWIETREKGYFSRRLSGLWATAPYLHNGSVPTLWDLLKPTAERPKRFAVGHREFDPVKVGYTDKPANTVWEFDTSISGNHNTGHEYGTRMTDEEKRDLLEYLKSL